MNILIRMFKFILLIIWQSPQLLLGFILSLFSSRISRSTENLLPCRFYSNPFGTWGISLGYFIFITPEFSSNGVRHEEGHTKQSQFLGPLYLIVVGIPSAFLFLIKRTMNKSFEWYHSRFPEKWADQLGKAYEYNQDIIQ